MNHRDSHTKAALELCVAIAATKEGSAVSVELAAENEPRFKDVIADLIQAATGRESAAPGPIRFPRAGGSIGTIYSPITGEPLFMGMDLAGPGSERTTEFSVAELVVTKQ